MKSLLLQIKREPGLSATQGRLPRGRARARQSTPGRLFTHHGVRPCPANTAAVPHTAHCPSVDITLAATTEVHPQASQEGLCGQSLPRIQSRAQRRAGSGSPTQALWKGVWTGWGAGIGRARGGGGSARTFWRLLPLLPPSPFPLARE